MNDVFARIALEIAISVELAAALLIAVGAVEALILSARAILSPNLGLRRDAWRRFAGWLLLGLEFELAADVVRSTVTPTWNDIGQLAAIAIIRTVLNYFLELDLKQDRRDTRD